MKSKISQGRQSLNTHFKIMNGRAVTLANV